MCGIYCSFLIDHNIDQPYAFSINNVIKNNLKKRGPDANDCLCKSSIGFAGFVLWQQGNMLFSQPATKDSIILLFNGDVFNTNKREEYGNISDTLWILNEIMKCKTDGELCSFFKTLKGPFSIIFYNIETKNLYFARDSIGRNSLLIERDDHRFLISSTSCFYGKKRSNCIEVPPLGIYKMNILDQVRVTLFPWLTSSVQWKNLQIFKSTMKVPVCIAQQIEPIWLTIVKSDRSKNYDFYKLVDEPKKTLKTLFCSYLKDKWFSKDLEVFASLLEKSVRDRVTITPKFCINCITSSEPKCHHSKIGVLFSGGLDCTILAILTDKYVDSQDSIDLINVAFEPLKANKNDWQVPDRCSAKISFQNVQKICPHRNWNFIEVNVTRYELEYSMKNHIKNLIFPLKSVLDESIGGAFWFASRGIGLCNGKLFKSSTRVIIVGSGADELFGGYTRHRAAYNRCKGSHAEKQINVLSELKKDWNRIPARNLGRDDRIISDNGKTPRAPYIEESIVQFVQEKHPSQLCCFLLKEGIGDKLFLRLYGYILGIDYAVQLKKRAIQFGSRIANKNEKADNISAFLC